MVITSMSEDELRISKIENIKSIYVYDLLVPCFDDEKRTFLGISIYFDNGNLLNYCELDKLFESFKNKLLNQYMLEKDNRKIRLDYNAKKFIENQINAKEISVPNIFLNTLSQKESLIMEGNKKIQKFLKVFNYNMDSILGIFGKEIDLNDIRVFRNNLNIGDKLSINIKSMDENKINFELIGLLDTIEFVNGTINIDSNSIKFYLASSENTFSYYSKFENEKTGIKRKIEVYTNEEMFFYDSSISNETPTNEEIEKIDLLLNNDLHQKPIDKIFKLPWGGYFINNIKDLETKSYYVEINDDYMLYMSNEEKTYIGDQSYLISASGGKEKTEIFRIASTNKGIIETYFADVPNALGTYKSNLSEKYFYFISEFDEFNNPKRIIVNPIKEHIDLEYKLFEMGKELKK